MPVTYSCGSFPSLPAAPGMLAGPFDSCNGAFRVSGQGRNGDHSPAGCGKRPPAPAGNIASMNATPSSALSPWYRESRAIVHLAAPLALVQLAYMAIITTDVVMMGWIGPRSARRRHPRRPLLLARDGLRHRPAHRRHPGVRPASGRPPLPHDPPDAAPRRVAHADPGPAERRAGVAHGSGPGGPGPGPAGQRRQPVLPAPHGLGPAAGPVAGGVVGVPGRPRPAARHPRRDRPWASA